MREKEFKKKNCSWYFYLSVFPWFVVVVLFFWIYVCFCAVSFSFGILTLLTTAGSSGRFAWFYSLAERMRFVRPSNQFGRASWGRGSLTQQKPVVKFFEFLNARNKPSSRDRNPSCKIKSNLLFVLPVL